MRDYMQVVSVAFVDGGEAGNVIPEGVKFGGTFRFLTFEGHSYLKQRIKEVRTRVSPLLLIACLTKLLEAKSTAYS